MEPFGDLLPFCEPAWYSQDSPFYEESHPRLRKVVRDFVEKNISPHVYDWNETGDKLVPVKYREMAGKLGLIRCVVGPEWSDCGLQDIPPLPAGIKPEEMDIFHEAIVWDEIIAGTASTGVLEGLIGGYAYGAPPIIQYGSEKMKKEVLPKLFSAECQISLAITEPGAGSDVQGLSTTAILDETGKYYIVNGTKKWITCACQASWLTTAVITKDDPDDKGGISFLLIPTNLPGVSIRRLDLMGRAPSGTSFVVLDDVKVPVENLIGEKNHGFKLVLANFSHERLMLSITALRCARVCYQTAFRYSLKRKTFGKRLIDHDVIRQKFSNMIREIETSQAMAEWVMYQWKMIPSHLRSTRLAGPAAMLKLHVTTAFEYVASEAVQIMGGVAYTRSGVGEKVERLYREVKAIKVPGGSSEIMADLMMKQALKNAKLMGAKL